MGLTFLKRRNGFLLTSHQNSEKSRQNVISGDTEGVWTSGEWFKVLRHFPCPCSCPCHCPSCAFECGPLLQMDNTGVVPNLQAQSHRSPGGAQSSPRKNQLCESFQDLIDEYLVCNDITFYFLCIKPYTKSPDLIGFSLSFSFYPTFYLVVSYLIAELGLCKEDAHWVFPLAYFLGLEWALLQIWALLSTPHHVFPLI